MLHSKMACTLAIAGCSAVPHPGSGITIRFSSRLRLPDRSSVVSSLIGTQATDNALSLLTFYSLISTLDAVRLSSPHCSRQLQCHGSSQCHDEEQWSPTRTAARLCDPLLLSLHLILLFVVSLQLCAEL
ncbi:hypothetical protein TcWFU_005735 [Taenia crassiceps]|uniref:Uncharacterized protein n=1 Tax=Taenia crassiceps TaxID=6207 RepID=A0ABR4Q7Y9_9CEST